jgi:hypothetical protein
MRTHLRLTCLVATALAGAVTSHAQSGGGYDLTWNTIDGGGGTSTGATYTMRCTIGQPDAGMFTGGTYTLGGGFWKGGSGGVTGVGEDPVVQDLPPVFALYAPAPSPFVDAATLRFDLPRESGVRVTVYDTRGTLVREVINGRLPAGRYARTWNGRDARGRDAAAGVYFVRVETDTERAERRLVRTR